MRLRHPEGDDVVDVKGDLVETDADDTFEAPSGWAEAFARRYGYDLAELRVTETCEVVKQDGEVCGRDLPCRFHSNDEDNDEDDNGEED